LKIVLVTGDALLCFICCTCEPPASVSLSDFAQLDVAVVYAIVKDFKGQGKITTDK
jgi:hypothetical protein